MPALQHRWSEAASGSARRLPRWRDLQPFARMRPFHRNSALRRLARCVSIDDLERLARRRVPRAVFDYVESGSDGEVAMRRNRAAYERVELRPT